VDSVDHHCSIRKEQKALPPKVVVQRLPITQARHNLGAVVKRVHLKNEYIILEKDGIPVAGVMNIDEFEDYLELQDPKIRAHIARSRKELLAGKSRRFDELLKELDEQAERRNKRRRPA
jgi:PHD/YefM family antitoxin component YafN of YafNO toxin-antitoxin module